MASQPQCVVAMEACASSHHWGREIGKLGHEVKLVPPIYVKPFVKRQKNDAADAEAICEAASRPTMRFVAVKTKAQQSRGMLFRTRDLLVRQRTQTTNALRGHFAEFGVVAPRGPAHVERLAEAIEDADSGLPDPVRELGALLLSPSSAVSGGIRRRPDPLFCWGNHRLRFPPTSRNHADFRSVGCHFGCQSSRGDALQIGAVCG